MDKTILTKLYITDKNKEGQLLVNKFGKGYKKIAIKTELTGDEWITGFINSDKDERLDWKEGQQVIIKITENGQWKNFEVADRVDLLEARVEALENMFIAKESKKEPATNEINTLDLPF